MSSQLEIVQSYKGMWGLRFWQLQSDKCCVTKKSMHVFLAMCIRDMFLRPLKAETLGLGSKILAVLCCSMQGLDYDTKV